MIMACARRAVAAVWSASGFQVGGAGSGVGIGSGFVFASLEEDVEEE